MNQKKQNKYKDILFILISSFVVVVAWIGFNLYHIWVTSTISEELQLKLTPIEGTFDTQTLEQLKSRKKVIPAFERQAVASPTSSFTSSVELSPTPSSNPPSGPTGEPNNIQP